MSLGPIPRSQVMAYAAEHGLGIDATDRLAGIIRAMDSEYLRLINAPESRTDRRKKDADDEVSAHDIEGSKQVLDRLRARAAARRKPKG